MDQQRQLAVVTGGSSGIGLELARLCAAEGFDLVIAADEPEIQTAAEELRDEGVDVTAVETDLASVAGRTSSRPCSPMSRLPGFSPSSIATWPSPALGSADKP